jgi:Ca2+-binding EF-hand superfamily protein
MDTPSKDANQLTTASMTSGYEGVPTPSSSGGVQPASGSVLPIHIAELRAAFNTFAAGGSSIGGQSLFMCMLAHGQHPTSGECRSMLQEMGAPPDGELEFPAFLAGMARKMVKFTMFNPSGKQEQEDFLKESVFERLDRNGQGGIRLDDLRAVFANLGAKLTADEAYEMIDKCDSTGTLILSYPDFLHAPAAYPSMRKIVVRCMVAQCFMETDPKFYGAVQAQVPNWAGLTEQEQLTEIKARSGMSDGELAQLKTRFDQLARDGRVGRAEISSLLPSHWADAICDFSGSDSLAWPDFAGIDFSGNNDEAGDMGPQEMFKIWDVDGDGFVGVGDLVATMSKLNDGEPFSEDDAKEMIEQVDSDGDGKLHLEDFNTFLSLC